MREVRAALVSGLRAPVRRARWMLLLWGARLLGPLLLLALPAYFELRDATAHHPRAAALLAPEDDETGEAGAWLVDLVGQGSLDDFDRVLLIVALDWVLVTLLTAGMVGRLVGGAPSLAAGLRRFGVRFLLLGVYGAVLVVVIQLLIEGVWRPAQLEWERDSVTQTTAIRSRFLREGTLLLSIWLVWLLHTCARVDLVTRDRPSAWRAWTGGFGLLLDRLPRLLLVEAGMAAAAGVAALLFGLTGRVLLAPTAGSGWFALLALLLAGTLVSLLRTGLEIGTLEARCRVLAPDSFPIETVPARAGSDPGSAETADQER